MPNLVGKSTHYQLPTTHSRVKPAFTLVEILVFLLVVLALVLVLLTSAGTLDKSRSVNFSGVAGKIASCEMERLRGLNYTVLPANGTSAIGSPCNADLSKLQSPNSADRTIVDYTGDPDIKQITIEVTWTEAGVQQSSKLVTLRSRYGI